MPAQRFTPLERRICAGCFLAYCLAYTARLNLASALPALSGALGLTDSQSGLIQTVFAVVYAAGQLINGALVDRISARRHVFIGLLLSALCNLLFGLSRAYWQLLLLWGLNGAAQSMLWTPIVKLLAAWFTGEKRSRASFYMCVTFVLGHLLAWAASGAMANAFGWRLSFLVPAGIALLAAALAFLLLKDRERSLKDAARRDNAPAERMPLRRLMFGSGLIMVLLSCIAAGFARDGVMTWAPTILSTLSKNSAGLSASALSLLIPAMNLLGLLLGQFLLHRAHGNIRLTVGLLLLAGAALCALLIIVNVPSMLLYAFLLGALCALMYSVSSLQTVMLPMEYYATGRVSLVAGLCDCCMYIGSSLVGVAGGALMDTGGMRAVYAAWVCASLAGAAAMLFSARARNAKVRAAPHQPAA